MQYKASGILVATALATLGYAGFSQTQDTQCKLAYVYTNAIMAQAPGAAEAQATYDREMANWNAEVSAMSDSLQAMIAQYDQQQVMLSPEARQQRQQEITAKQREYQQRTSDLEQVAQRRQQELLQPILDRVSTVLRQIREEGGYTMIFDASPGSNLVEADTTLNITALVIERMQAQSASQGGAPN